MYENMTDLHEDVLQFLMEKIKKTLICVLL